MSRFMHTTVPSLDDVALGLAASQGSTNKFGWNPEVASGTVEDVWDQGGTYTWPTTADITHLRQTLDDATMQGEDVEVQGLDTNWNLTVQTVTLDGADSSTPVALGTALRRVFRLKVLADVVAAQNIEIRNVGGGTRYAVITAGNNQSLMAMYSIPAGYQGLMYNYYAGGAITAANNPDNTKIKLWTADRGNGYEFQLKNFNAFSKENPHLFHPFSIPLVIPEKTDIKITAQPANKALEVIAGFDLKIVRGR